MPEDGPRGLESDGTEATSATRVGRAECADSAHPTAGPASAGPVTSPGAPVPGPRSRPRPGRAFRRRDRPEDPARRPYRAPWLIALLVFAVYLTISLFRYLQLNPSSWDLGIFTELVKQYAHLHAPVADVRGAGVQPARRPLLADHRADRAVLPDRAVPGHAARRAGLPDRGVCAPGHLGRGRQARPPCGRRHRRGLRVLLGPAADDQLRLPRDRVRGTAARVLAVGAGPRADPGGGGLGPAAGLRQGGPGLYGGRDRHPDDHHQPAARPARPGRDLRRRTAHRVGRALVGAGHHDDHPALQRGPSLPVLGATAARSARAATSRPAARSASSSRPGRSSCRPR